MTNYSYMNSTRSDSYGIQYDEDDFDDDDMDGYDELSEYDEDDIARGDGRHTCSNADGRGGSSEFRRQRALSEGSGDQLEPGDDNRRDHHNQLERKRRASIKSSYNDLREAIPSLRGSKASRAVILQRAVECIEDLTRCNQDRTHCLEALKRQNDVLDQRVQELQRIVQRVDGEDNTSVPGAASTVTSTVSGGMANSTGTLRLVPGGLVGSTSAANSNLPVYRLLPQDCSTDHVAVSDGHVSHTSHPTVTVRAGIIGGASHKPLISHNNVSSRTSTSPVLHLMTTSTTNSNTGGLTYSGMDALSGAVNLVGNGPLPCSSSSSGASNSELHLPSSQRSSPGGLSSSSSNASSLNQSNVRREHSEESSLVIETPIGLEDEAFEAGPDTLQASSSCAGSAGQCLRFKANFMRRSSLRVRNSSPPSILLTVPIRSSPSSRPNPDSSVKSKHYHNLTTTLSESAHVGNDPSKRPRLS
ncbi:unnamed protein product [Calicophoron daubneyi]|uniref:BHLH domain-containing protein n=1 Tax=Calicophoron daubneyi TaxID=300641 RepID=A0AAV2T617_CALDB